MEYGREQYTAYNVYDNFGKLANYYTIQTDAFETILPNKDLAPRKTNRRLETTTLHTEVGQTSTCVFS